MALNNMSAIMQHSTTRSNNKLFRVKYYMILISPLPIAAVAILFGRYSILFPLSSTDLFILGGVRLPRVLMTMMTGAALSIAGASLQSTLRNPLASPYILGLSQGAAFGAALAMIVLPYSQFMLPVMAFIFGLIAITITCMLARIRGTFSNLAVVLSGVIVAGVFTAFLSIVKLIADPYSLSGLVFWTMGGFYRVDWGKILIVAPGLVTGFIILSLMGWRLNVLSMGEEDAKSLGVNVRRDTIIVVSLSALVCALAIAVSGIVAWVGLIIPQMVRGIIGPDNRYIIPASLAFGASFLLIVDTLCRSLFTFEVPVSIITTLVAAPYFILLLRRIGGGWR